MKRIMQTGNVRGKTNGRGLIIHIRAVCFSINPFCTFETSKHTNRQEDKYSVECQDIVGTAYSHLLESS